MGCSLRRMAIDVKRTSLTKSWYLIMGEFVYGVDSISQLVDAILLFAARGLPVGLLPGVNYAHDALQRADRQLAFGFTYEPIDLELVSPVIAQLCYPRWYGTVFGIGVSYIRQDPFADPTEMRSFIQSAVDLMELQILQNLLEET